MGNKTLMNDNVVTAVVKKRTETRLHVIQPTSHALYFSH